MTAVLFPGQGSQRPGMAAAFREAWPETRRTFEVLDGAVDRDLRALCSEAGADRLRATENTQPAVYAAGLAVWRGIERRHDPEVAAMAGHSLGHWTALAAAGGLDDGTGARLVCERGEQMARAAQRRGPGRMVAVLLAPPDTVTAACEGVEGASVAAFNAPRQTVVSGTDEGVERVRDAIAERADRVRFTDLDVGGAFHSPVMDPARERFGATLADHAIDAPAVPVVSDVSATAYTDPAVAARDLRAQVTAPIDWVGVVEALRDRGVERFVELPPAGTLVDLVEQVAPDAETVALDSPDRAAEVFG